MRVGSVSDVNAPVVFDVTDQAGFFAQVAQMMPGLIYVFNHDTMSNEYANRSVGQFLGYSEQEVQEMGDALLPTLMHPDDFAQLPQHFECLSKLNAEQQASFEYRVTNKNGEEVWLRSIDAVVQRGNDNRVIRHVGIATNITAQKQAEAELFKMNRVLEARVEARTSDLQNLNDDLEKRVADRTADLNAAHEDLKQLTYIATHDLRVPVNNMASLLDMLADARPTLEDEHVETLEWMHDVCTQAQEKLDALICAAQANVGTQSPVEPVCIETCLEKVLLNLHYQIKSTHAQVKIDLQTPVAVFLAQSMETVLQALIGNALKYRSTDRKTTISVSSQNLPHAVEIKVSDNGTGIDLKRDGEKVFALFQRAHVEPSGAGVSLYMAQRIVENCGGAITVRSEPNVGSVFSVILPDQHEGSVC